MVRVSDEAPSDTEILSDSGS